LNRTYQLLFPIVWLFCALVYPRRKRLCPALPAGGAIICANHSHLIDPVLVCMTVGHKNEIHFMAKAELSEKKAVAGLLKKVGVFFVSRGSNDLGAIKTAMSLLKKGEKIGIFPEGTRVSEDTAVTAKNGAVRLAMRMKVPLIPVYISTRKKPFSPVDVVIGEPYSVSETDDIAAQTELLMQRINSLNPARAAQ